MLVTGLHLLADGIDMLQRCHSPTQQNAGERKPVTVGGSERGEQLRGTFVESSILRVSSAGAATLLQTVSSEVRVYGLFLLEERGLSPVP